MGTFKKINYIFDTRQKIKLAILLCMILIGSIFEMLGVSAILPLVGVAMNPDAISQNKYYKIVAELFQLETVSEFVLFLALVLALLYILKNAYLIFYRNYQFKFTYQINRTIALKMMNCYLYQDYLFHVEHNVAELQRNITSDTTQFISTVTAVINVVVEGCTCTFLILLLLVADFMTTLIVIMILAVGILIYWGITKRLQMRYGIQARTAGKDLNKWLLQSFAGIKEIKVMNREDFFYNNCDAAYQKQNSAYRKYNVLNMLPKHVIETIVICSVLATMSIRILQGTNIKEFLTSLSAFGVAAIRMLPSFNRITEYIGTITFNKAGVENVFKDLKETENLEIKKSSQRHDIEKLHLQNEIKVENITFLYPNTTKEIFKDASLVIRKNESVAFVGSSGAGKTTLADIIIGLLQLDKGHVFVDGCDIFAHLDAWHKAIGYIPQMIYLMDDTIRANVVFGMEESKIDDEKVWKALERAEIAEFVKGLDEGIYTRIGDRGIRLSGGQRQRLGIARALYEEPEVLILDEATSALDNETEAAVMDSIDSLHGKTTLIIIAHRLSTIQNCDKVYEVKDGKVVLKG